MSECLDRFDQDLDEKKELFLDDLSCAALPGNLDPSDDNPELSTNKDKAVVQQSSGLASVGFTSAKLRTRLILTTPYQSRGLDNL